MDTVSLYIHIPFCRAKCAYCDFNSYPGLDHLFERYGRALQREMRWLGRKRSLKADTIYLGGGTPTVLPLALLGEVLDACREHFTIAEGAEITVEANPGTVDGDYLAGLREIGVNRLSLGVQSFCDDELRLLGRIHTAAQAIETCHLARETGFGNVNLDLIYGLPRQTLSDWQAIRPCSWQATLQQAIHLRPDHLSLYCLSVEEGTPLERRIARRELPAPDPDRAAEMYTLAEEALDRAGYVHYEISNWAQPGHECRHNLTYWRNRSYLGLGAGAHSYFDQKRWYNILSPAEYITRLEADWQRPFPPAVEEVEEIGEVLEMAETMILGLRLVQEGVRLADFRERFGRELMAVYGREIREMEQAGLLEVDGERVRLTARGRLLGNEVFQQFLPHQ
ncbi:MAG TPA: radical SAM family heme chaperone HemW [Anaerolineae bacterium]|nr:radical SAM family heme chaperone HemW [Anaerolineae bacterium]